MREVRFCCWHCHAWRAELGHRVQRDSSLYHKTKCGHCGKTNYVPRQPAPEVVLQTREKVAILA